MHTACELRVCLRSMQQQQQQLSEVNTGVARSSVASAQDKAGTKSAYGGDVDTVTGRLSQKN